MMAKRPPPPLSTFRLQLSPEFGFGEALGLLDYLQELGVHTLYLSPVFKAREGSTHGYDVADPRRISQALGGEAAFARLSDELSRRGMGLLVDFVPNHMAAHSDNPWWWDVLKYGVSSPYADHFDINWHPSHGKLHNRVLIPVLGAPLEEIAEKGELSLRWNRHHFEIRYYEHRFPLHPVTYFDLLNRIPHQVKAKHKEITSFVGEFMELEGADFPDRSKCERLEKKLAAWLNSSPKTLALASDIEKGGQNAGFLMRLLLRQSYELAFWRRAFSDINYRRFFDVNELAGLRMERPEVFKDTHETLLRLIREGRVTGVRIDHIDGLREPRAYLKSLSRAADTFLVVEKILENSEDLPDDWPVAGTTGYDFLNHVNGLFIAADGLAELDRLYTEFTGLKREYPAFVFAKKKAAIESLFGAEALSLARRLREIQASSRTPELETAIIAVCAGLPVYRTYLGESESGPAFGTKDLEHLNKAFEMARIHAPDATPQALSSVRSVFDAAPGGGPAGEWVRSWQQLTGAATAMGVENSAFFSFNRLISMNEVGSGPGVPPDSPDAFHRFNATRLKRHPHSMSCTSTHDTKMSGDVRARINLLSEIPEEWAFRIRLWSEMNESLKHEIDLELMPDRNLEYLLYQALIGSWPLHRENEAEFARRFKAYAVKAAREAREHTSWIDPAPDYEAAVESFVESILDPALSGRFVSDARNFAERIAWPGALNSLAQIVLQMTSPGIPDLYQGEGLWNLNLVDPDNRRRVNFDRREQRLHAIPDHGGAAELTSKWRDGRIKLHTIRRTLELRKRYPELFLDGSYMPISVEAPDSRRESVVTFSRIHGDRAVLVAVPRLLTSLHGSAESPSWDGVQIVLPDHPVAERGWTHLFTEETIAAPSDRVPSRGGRLGAGDLFSGFPVAVLVSRE